MLVLVVGVLLSIMCTTLLLVCNFLGYAPSLFFLRSTRLHYFLVL
ncbi:hypothetical protein DSUL_150054 [Desulfovibrionales bacterium]